MSEMEFAYFLFAIFKFSMVAIVPCPPFRDVPMKGVGTQRMGGVRGADRCSVHVFHTFSLSGNGLGPEGGRAVAEALAANTTLTELG